MKPWNLKQIHSEKALRYWTGERDERRDSLDMYVDLGEVAGE